MTDPTFFMQIAVKLYISNKIAFGKSRSTWGEGRGENHDKYSKQCKFAENYQLIPKALEGRGGR